MLKLSLTLIVFVSCSAIADTPDTKRQNELRNLLEQDCGSCHGLTRQGGLGPALTAEALKDKPLEMLAITIKEGRPGTPMPPWKYLLSDADINFLAKSLKQEVVAKQ